MNDYEMDEILGELEIAEPFDEILGSARVMPKIVARKTASTHPSSGFVIRTTPAGNNFTSLHVIKAAPFDHKQSIVNARTVGKRTQEIAKKLQKLSTKAKPPVKPATKVKGAASSARHAKVRSMTPTQIKKLAADTMKFAKAALDAADRHEKLIHLPAKTKTKIKGDALDEVLGQIEFEILGDDPAATTATATDSTASATDLTLTPSAADVAAMASLPGAPDFGLGPVPTVATPLTPITEYTPDPGSLTDMTVYSSDSSVPGSQGLPLGAVYCNLPKGLQHGDLGSHSLFYGGAPMGFSIITGKWGGMLGVGEHGYSGASWLIYRGMTKGKMDTIKQSESQDLGNWNRDLRQMSLTSVANGWGPIIGNPNGQYPNLRLDVGGGPGGGDGVEPRGKGVWFWFWDKAPTALQAPVLALRLKQQQLDHQTAVTAAAADAASTVAQDQLDAATAAAVAKQQADADAQTAQQQAQALAAAQASSAQRMAALQAPTATVAAPASPQVAQVATDSTPTDQPDSSITNSDDVSAPPDELPSPSDTTDDSTTPDDSSTTDSPTDDGDSQ